MKIRGVVLNVKTNEIKETEEEFDENQFALFQKSIKQMKMQEIISHKMNELLRQMAIQELIKEGKIKPEDLKEIQ